MSAADLLADLDFFYQQTPAQRQSQGQSLNHSERAPRVHQSHSQPAASNFNNDVSGVSNDANDAWDFGVFESSLPKQADSGYGEHQSQPVVSAQQYAAPSQSIEPSDDWGDFESGPGEIVTAPKGFNQGLGEQQSPFHDTSASSVRNGTPRQPEQDAFIAFTPSFQRAQLERNRQQSRPTSGKKNQAISRPPRDENVLFDAEEDLDDDFGDFESAHNDLTAERQTNSNIVSAQQKSMPRSADFGTSFGQSHSDSPQWDVRGNVASRTMQNVTKSHDLPQPPIQNSMESDSWATNDSASDWQAFDESPDASEEAQHSQRRSLRAGKDDNAWNTSEESVPAQKESAEIDANATAKRLNDTNEGQTHSLHNLSAILPEAFSNEASVPPSNIPPPSVLLPLFESIWTPTQELLFEPLANESTANRHALLANSEVRIFLTRYLSVAVVFSRIIAGRKLRWKRDTLLAQSMSIGPATGKSGGMKLTGIDRAETAKEDREVTEALRVWRAQLGRLRAAVQAAGTLGPVPEVTENLIMRTAKESEGALTAARACALCGLKRNERISKVDVDVQDIFGEWWAEHWGHKTCQRLWNEHKHNLPRR